MKVAAGIAAVLIQVCVVVAQNPQLPPSTSSWVPKKPGVASGKVEEFTVASKYITPTPRKVWVYTPAGYDARRASGYDLIVAFDGGAYREIIPLPTILDNLAAAGKAPAMVAVMVENGSGPARLGDLANRAPFARFMAEEVMPWVREHYNVTHDPQHTIVTGSSAGGLGAAYVALQHPELFGNVLSQSGAFWRGNDASNDAPYEWLTAQYKASPKLSIAFWMEIGALETQRPIGGAAPVAKEANQRFYEVLQAKGYRAHFEEVPGANHEIVHWRDKIADGIIWLTSGWKQ